MTTFNDSFYSLKKTPPNNVDGLLEERIYEEPIAHYQDINDFDLCKAQLLKLLDYITSLNPVNLKIFSDYRNNIARSLTKETHTNDIVLTLKAAKKSIESSLHLIEDNHQQLTPNTFDPYTVTVCFSGAFSNLQSILEHFNKNNLVDLLVSVKKRMLQAIILDLLKASPIEMLAGSEVHFVNGLYNYYADAYGCPEVMDHLAPMSFGDGLIAYSELYIKKHFSVTNFIKMFQTMIPMPPETIISTSEAFAEVEEFFRFLGISSEEKRHLYAFDDDYVNLIPKPNFSIYLECIIASFLNQYLKNNHWIAPHLNLEIIDNGSRVVGVRKGEDEKFEYFLLDEEIVKNIIQDIQTPQYLYLRLIMNSPDILCSELERKARPELIQHYFFLLLKHNYLSQEMIVRLIDIVEKNSESFINSKRYLTKYILQRFYPLEKEQLSKLVESFPVGTIEAYINSALLSKKYDYVEVFCNIENLPFEFLINILYRSVNEMDIKLFDIITKRLKELNYPFNEFRDTHGNSLVHMIVKRNINSALYEKEIACVMLEYLSVNGVDFNCFDGAGLTPAQFAFLNERGVTFLRKLCDLGATLELVDKNGKKIISLDGVKNAYGVSEYILLIQKGYEFLLGNPNINWGEILNPKLKLSKKCTLAHYAAFDYKVDFLKLLKEHQINLEVKDCLGYTPIFCAVRDNQKEAFRVLAEFGVDLHTVDKDGNTLAHLICKKRNFNIKDKEEWLTLISQYGAKLNQKNNERKTPVDMIVDLKKAVTSKKIKVLIDRLIREQDERANVQANTGNELQGRSSSMLTQFGLSRGSKRQKKCEEDTIHSRSPSNSP